MGANQETSSPVPRNDSACVGQLSHSLSQRSRLQIPNLHSVFVAHCHFHASRPDCEGMPAEADSQAMLLLTRWQREDADFILGLRDPCDNLLCVVVDGNDATRQRRSLLTVCEIPVAGGLFLGGVGLNRKEPAAIGAELKLQPRMLSGWN